MTEKKRYTVILRGDIRVEVESAGRIRDLVSEWRVCLDEEATLLDTMEGFVFRTSEVIAILESSAITTPTYEPVVQTEESEFEASERARKERGE